MDKNINLFKYAINIELLEYQYPEYGDILFYKGIPFTGLGYELYSDGQLRDLTPYENGFANGICREWYPDGELMCEYELKRGSSYGRETYWHPNGSIKSIGNYELGIELDYQEWDESGNLVESRKLDPDNPNSNYRTLLKFRERAE